MATSEFEDQYNRMYIEFVNYIGRNFSPSMAESTSHAESLTNIVKEELEPKIEEAENEV